MWIEISQLKIRVPCPETRSYTYVRGLQYHAPELQFSCFRGNHLLLNWAKGLWVAVGATNGSGRDSIDIPIWYWDSRILHSVFYIYFVTFIISKYFFSWFETNCSVTSLLPSIFNQQVRTAITYSLRKGKRKTVKPVVKRFLRLHCGLWLRRRVIMISLLNTRLLLTTYRMFRPIKRSGP